MNCGEELTLEVSSESDIKVWKSNCPLCNKERYYKNEKNMLISLNKNAPCRSCASSISAGGKGAVYVYDGKKKCSGCHEHKEFDEFSINSVTSKYYNRCKTCQKTYNNSYGTEVARYLRYKTTKEEILSLLLMQNNKCFICLFPVTLETCEIDHCHNSSKIRGILCPECNRGLGQFKDSIPSLERAIIYLKQSNDGK